MAYGPTFLYSIFPPHKKIVSSRAEELEAFQNGWRDTPFSEVEIDAARLAAKIPVQEQTKVEKQNMPVEIPAQEPTPVEKQDIESQPNAERPDTTATDGQEGEKTARKRGRPRKQTSEDLS